MTKKIERLIIGNDHGGYRLKQVLLEELAKLGVEVEDIGSNSDEIVRYPYYAEKVARAVAAGEADRGILICSTGIGMSIVANRFPGVRAALVNDHYSAVMTRRHNDSNVLCLGGKIIGPSNAVDCLEAWLESEYEGGRHDISLGLLHEIDESGGTKTQGL